MPKHEGLASCNRPQPSTLVFIPKNPHINSLFFLKKTAKTSDIGDFKLSNLEA